MWPNPQHPADLVTFTEEVLNGEFQFVFSRAYAPYWYHVMRDKVSGYWNSMIHRLAVL